MVITEWDSTTVAHVTYNSIIVDNFCRVRKPAYKHDKIEELSRNKPLI